MSSFEIAVLAKSALALAAVMTTHYQPLLTVASHNQPFVDNKYWLQPIDINGYQQLSIVGNHPAMFLVSRNSLALAPPVPFMIIVTFITMTISTVAIITIPIDYPPSTEKLSDYHCH